LRVWYDKNALEGTGLGVVVPQKKILSSERRSLKEARTPAGFA